MFKKLCYVVVALSLLMVFSLDVTAVKPWAEGNATCMKTEIPVTVTAKVYNPEREQEFIECYGFVTQDEYNIYVRAECYNIYGLYNEYWDLCEKN